MPSILGNSLRVDMIFNTVHLKLYMKFTRDKKCDNYEYSRALINVHAKFIAEKFALKN